MNLIQTEISSYAESLDDFKPEYSPVKVTSVVSFFRLKGRTTSMIRANVECIPDLHYCLYSPLEKRYYLKEYRGYDLDTLFFYKPTLTFSGDDVSVEQLRAYVQDGNIWLLFTKEQVADTTAVLERLWKSHFTYPGKLDYRSYIALLKTSLEYEEYREYGKDLIGFKTMSKQYEKSIRETWEAAYAKGKTDKQ